MPVNDADQIASAGFERLQELLADMGWTEKYAIGIFYRQIAKPLGQGEKSIKQWWDRASIPSHHIFNIGGILGIDPRWLARTTDRTKAECVDEFGLYAQVMAGRPARANSKK